MVDDVALFFSRYAALYMAGDADGVADLCETPFLAVRMGATIHLADRRALVDHLAGLMAAYRNAGAAVAETEELEPLVQGDRAALVTVHWNVRAADGTMIRDFRTSYQLVAHPWRILGYVNHDTVG